MMWFTGAIDWLVLAGVTLAYLLVGGWLLHKQLSQPKHRPTGPGYALLFALATLTATAAIVVAGVLGVHL